MTPFLGMLAVSPAPAPEPSASSGNAASRASQRLTSALSQTRLQNGLAAGKTRLALLYERGHAPLRVLAREELAEAVALGGQVRRMVALERVVDGRLRRGEREWALRRQAARDFHRLVHQLIRLEDRVHEPDAQRLLCVDRPAG